MCSLFCLVLEIFVKDFKQTTTTTITTTTSMTQIKSEDYVLLGRMSVDNIDRKK